MTVLVAATLVGAAVAVAVLPAGRRRATRRLAKLPVPTTGGPGGGNAPVATAVAVGTPARLRRDGSETSRYGFRGHVDRRRCVAVLAGAATAALAGGWFGVLAGAGLVIGLDRALRRLEPAGRRARRLAEAAELPLAADLLAVALRGGAPADRATAAVAEVLPGPLGERLTRVARMLALGAAADEAWAQLAPVAGAARLIRAAVRSAEHGGALADALRRLADDLRADRSIAVEAAARRAGVLIVLPLGLCFLPAFMLAGLVPVILAVLGDVL